ncbi:MAG: hypothetical protein ACXVIY_11060 [Mucilaginibacter sp.]
MKKLTLILLGIFGCGMLHAQINKVQHFNAHCSDAGAKELFMLFNQTFELPVVYDYQTFGNFSSGGLWLGNITFEVVGHKGGDDKQAAFIGVSLEPTDHTDVITPLLDHAQIAHENPNVTQMGGKPFYTVTYLKDFTTANRKIFVCDYADRPFIDGFAKKADSLFKVNSGGPLGITGLRTIVIGTADVTKQAALWEKIPAIKKVNDHLFSFSDGPNIELVRDSQECLKEIVVKVRSKKKAKDFLAQQQLLKKGDGRLMIAPDKLHGLAVILVE